MSFDIMWEALTPEERAVWVTAALSIQMGEVRTPAQKKEARFRLRFLARIRDPAWFMHREAEVQREGFQYACNAKASRAAFLRNIVRGIESDIDYQLRKA